jgi:hypothetical protein
MMMSGQSHAPSALSSRESPSKPQDPSNARMFNPLNAELIPVYHLLALSGAHHILHVGRISVKHQKRTERFVD